MKNMKSLILGFLVGLCLGVVLFAGVPVVGQGGWNPWADINDDGWVNAKDAVLLGTAFGSSGAPLNKASLAYDSDWIDISDMAGQYFTVTHDLNTTNLMIDITGKTTADGGVHQRNIGGTDFVAGWNKTYGGAYDNVAYFGCLIQTADGGYALLGYEAVAGSGNQGNVSLRKTDSRGNVQWSKTYGGADCWFYASSCPLVQTTDGGYAFAFTKRRAGASDYDFWLVRTDAFGTPLWNQTYGGAADDYVYSMIQSREGGFALVGDTHSFGAYSDGYLVVTDSVGNMLWSNHCGGSWQTDSFIDIVQTGDGYAMAGITYSYGAGDMDMWLVKTNASGDMQWYKTYGYSVGEGCYALIQTFDGGYALAGDTHNFGAGDADFWLLKTDSLGNHLWNKTYGGVNRDIPSDLVQTSDGGYVLAGYTGSFGAGNYDFWLVKTDASGNRQWDRTYGGVYGDYAYVLVQTSDGGYAMAGTSYLASGSDMRLIKTDAAGNVLDGFKYGLAWVDSSANSITLYRGTDDAYWNYVRVRVWKVKESP